MILEKAYKYISFERADGFPGKTVWNCINNKSRGLLGFVRWYDPWRQYCFFPADDCVFNISCLGDIQDFIKTMAERKAGEKK